MREIEFRGRALKSKLWVRGYYWTNENGNHFIRQTVDLNGYFRIADIEVNPETVGQYTGLKDKNGIKIYEGDIVRVIYQNKVEIFEVRYEEENTCFRMFRKTNYNETFLDFTIEETDLYEVIGNIHDNPELLEREEI